MVRTPEDIKKGLWCCGNGDVSAHCGNCPYNLGTGDYGCITEHNADSLALIHQLERERDAAVELLHGFCGACANEGKHEICVECSRRLPFEPDDKDDYWQWRGVQEEKHA